MALELAQLTLVQRSCEHAEDVVKGTLQKMQAGTAPAANPITLESLDVSQLRSYQKLSKASTTIR